MTLDRAPQSGDGGITLGGLSVQAPRGWEVRIRRLANAGDGEPMPVLHAATVPLIPERGDYGSGVVEGLGPTDVFVSLCEFAPEDANTPLFASRSAMPTTVDASAFHPKQLQRVISGQAGQQVFFSYENRAFCLYVVIGSAALAEQLGEKASELLSSIVVEIGASVKKTSTSGRYGLRAE